MILILSKNGFEYTTDSVIDWLLYYNVKFRRINFDNLLELIEIENDKLYIDGINVEKFTVCWNRRYSNSELSSLEDFLKDKSFKYIEAFKNNLIGEKKAIVDLLFSKLKNIKWISTPEELKIGKLTVLEKAKICNLNVPEYIVTSKKHKVKEFKKKFTNIISKSISDFKILESKNGSFYNFITKEVSYEDLDTIPESDLYISFFQQKIEKEYEIRVFFIENKFYPMAIFSQNDKKTQLDYRDYNYEHPNRLSKITLPKKLMIKIQRLVEELELSTGSIDLIKEKNTSNYYFLEINPAGQFSNVSYECNYFLEKKIAQTLINLNNAV